MDITLVLVTVLSLALAAVMTVLAWRLAREDRRRSDARVAVLAAEIHGASRPAVDLPLRAAPLEAPVAASGELFAATTPRPRLVTVAAIGAVVILAAGVVLFLASGGGRMSASSRTHGTSAPAAEPAVTTAAAPLELVALTHERDGDRLIVRGIVRNPASGAPMTGVTAVVFLFNRDGGFVTSARAPLSGALAPGADMPFVVDVPGAADVGRYRVSFRTEDRVVPHVDRRDRPTADAR